MSALFPTPVRRDPSRGRRVVARTAGRGHGPITRLMSPGDLGEQLKPFVFLACLAPLALLGLLSREALRARRVSLGRLGQRAKVAMGLGLVAIGLLVLSGLDKRAEAWAVAASPDWLTALTTRY